MTVSNNDMREVIFEACEREGKNILLSSLKKNVERDDRVARKRKKEQSTLANDDGNKGSKKELARVAMMEREINDMLIKVIRLIANLSINRSIGDIISRKSEIKLLVKLLQSKSIEEQEELVLNVISAITNLSFYHQTESASVDGRPQTAAGGYKLVQSNRDILACLIPYLFSANVEVVVEGVRALGNFSRDREFRHAMTTSRVDEVLIVLLDHSNYDIIFGVCGVLLNIAAERSAHAVFFQKESVGLDKLLSVLTRFGLDSYMLTDVICKTFLNLKATKDLNKEPFPADISRRLLHLNNQIIQHLKRELSDLDPAEVQTSPEVDQDARVLEEAKGLLDVCEKLQVVMGPAGGGHVNPDSSS